MHCKYFVSVAFKFLFASKMVRMCKVKGCKTQQGKGKLLFAFPKDPIMRKLWISRTGQTQWNPRSTSCICEVNRYVYIDVIFISYILNGLLTQLYFRIILMQHSGKKYVTMAPGCYAVVQCLLYQKWILQISRIYRLRSHIIMTTFQSLANPFKI